MVGIGSVLADAAYRVPIYQRSFAWDDEEIEDYWRDLKGALDGSVTEYFLGTIVLSEETSDGRLMVIDGQQRLATTTLFIAAIRDAYADAGTREPADNVQGTYISRFDFEQQARVPRLVLNAEDATFFRELVVEQGDPTTKRESHERLRAALVTLRAYLDEDLGGLPDVGARLAEWLKFVSERALG